VDVAAAGPVELTGSAPARRRPTRTALLLVPVVLLVALLVVDGLLTAAAVSRSHRDDARAAATQAARAEAVALTTIDYRSAARDLQRILTGATGGLRTQFASQEGDFPAVLARTKSVSRGSVLSSGLISLSTRHGNATVDVAVDASVSTSASAASVVKHYRMVVHLVRSRGRWLVDDVAFEGVPS
jgi:Mce-associated membrane protein